MGATVYQYASLFQGRGRGGGILAFYLKSSLRSSKPTGPDLLAGSAVFRA